MAYDRYDTRDAPRDERSRWSDNRNSDQGRNRDDRGFFDRASDEVASWFGDEEAERRRREDQMRDQREGGWSSRDHDRHTDQDRHRDYERERMSSPSHLTPGSNSMEAGRLTASQVASRYSPRSSTKAE